MEAGSASYTAPVPLPHARRRLKLDDPLLVGLFARRFGDLACVAMDDGAILRWVEGRWTPVGGDGSRRLLPDGGVEELAA